MSDSNEIRLFTESNESMGIMFNSYKTLYPIINSFLNIIEGNVKSMLEDPLAIRVDLRNEINKFKSDISIEFTPDPISMGNLVHTKKDISEFRSQIDPLLSKLSVLKDKMSFGGNFKRAILFRPKVYSKDIDDDNYEIINGNIRNIDRALDWVEKSLIDLYNMIDQDLNILTIVDRVYNKRRIYESVTDETFEDITTPKDLLEWMDCIQYGWISKKDQKVYGTGEDDDEEIFYKEYFLQSPASLIKNKIGVCWDQTELERDWFKFHYSCNFAIIYIEIKDGAGCPTHTFLIYEDEEGKGTHWFEHSWGIYRGIHTYKKFQECIADIIEKHQKFNNDTASPVEIHYLRDMPRLNSSCEEFMKYARKQPLLDPSKWTPDTEWEEVFKGKALFKEAYDLDTLPDILYFGTPNKLDSKTISSITPRGLFMAPYIGLASMFIIDRSKVVKEYFNAILAKNKREMYRNNYNIEYKEWDYTDDQLKQPLNKVHMYHNIPQFREVGSGTSTGYIYAIDISKVKGELELYTTQSADREIIYKGSARLPIKEVTEHKIDWEITYRKSSDGKVGTFESRPIKESVMYECGFREGTGLDGDDLSWIEQYLQEEGESYTPPTEEPKKKSRAKEVDNEESDKNGVRRKKLYIAFIEWCKAYNSKNTFGSIFDQDAFRVTYPFVPNEMRYFYRLANPLLCVLSGELTFFQASELRKLNAKNSHLNEMMIFAATPNDVRVFSNKDKKVYRGEEENGALILREPLASSFDIYIQNMIRKGDILNGPIDDELETDKQV